MVAENGIGSPLSDRINRMDRIKKYESKINPDNPARLGIAYFTKRSRVNPV
jgi:hypothetical protein